MKQQQFDLQPKKKVIVQEKIDPKDFIKNLDEYTKQQEVYAKTTSN